uniref:Poly(A) RNA polymerase mitochondrial-like central palm domain-containing protein n=1 Tax=Dunaliella viridis TaxID=140095 RepID=A7U4W8_9CHLO|nr:hypothetical protein [Dunaliella viridis]
MHTAWPGQGGGLPAEGQHAAQTTAPGDGYLMPQQQMQQQQQQQQQQRQLQQRRALPQSMPYPPQVLPPAPIQPYPPYPYPQLVPWGVPLPFEGPPAIPPVPLAFNAPPLMHPPPPYPTPYALPPQLPPHLTDSGPLERKLSGSKRVYADLGATTPVSHQPSRVRMGQYALSGLGGSSAGLPAGPTDYTNQLTLCEPLDWAEQKGWAMSVGKKSVERDGISAIVPGACALFIQAAAERSDGAPYLAALTRNIINTVNALQPTPGDVAARAALMRVVEAAATYALPEFQGRLQVLPFGSFVSGLGTKASDIDVVIVGVREPQNRKGFYDRSERPDVARILDRVGRSLRNMFKNEISIVNFFLIRTSRIPVLKVSACLRHPPPEAQGYQNRPISVDISATTAAGPQAARYIAQQAQTFKALRPIVLIVKAFLKVSNLNDVSTGGLQCVPQQQRRGMQHSSPLGCRALIIVST